LAGMTENTKRRAEHTKNLVPAEGNFEEHPYFRVGDRNAGTGILKYENKLRTRDGNVLQQSWTVRAAHGRGLPGRFDQDVYVALLQMIDNKGLPEDGWLSFSLYELVELMGRGHSGRDYRQVRESLQRLASTTIESDNAFYHRGRKAYIRDTFSLITEVKLSEYEGSNGERTDRNRVHLSDYFKESYQANYLKSIDARFYWSLSSPIAKRLYRLIDKKRAGRRMWEVELFSLKDRIPLSDYKYASKIKEKLAPAHAELIEKDFLEQIDYRKGDDSEFASYKITESFHNRRSAVALEPRTGDEFFCVQRLKAEGMQAETAERLVSAYGPARVMQYVEALPYQKNLRNPAGWLRKAIENGYELDMPPAGAGAMPNGTPSAGGNGESANAADASGRRREEYGWLFAEDEPDPAEDAEQRRVGDDSQAARAEDLPPPRPTPDPSAEGPWREMLDAAAEDIDASSLRVWFEGITPVRLEARTLTISVPNSFAKEYIETRFHEVLERHLREQLGHEAALEIEIWGSRVAADQSGSAS
jgi:plasmid replication initiation protein